MKNLIKKILKEETEEILVIPGLNYFPDGVDGLIDLLKSKKVNKWSFDGSLNLRNYEGDLSWIEGLVSISGNLNLANTSIKSLQNLKSVGGYLTLYGSQIESLGNLQSVVSWLDLKETPIKSLGNLQSVGGNLNLKYTSIESLGNLQSVGGMLDLRETPVKSFRNLKYVKFDLVINDNISEKYTDEEIRSMVNVGGKIIRPWKELIKKILREELRIFKPKKYYHYDY
jgi:hypothetical protein